MSLSELDLVLLAGGRGRRLGGIVKALLRSRGEALLDVQLRLPGTKAWVVAPADLQDKLQAASRASDRDIRTLVDPGEGPAVALSLASQASAAVWLLVVGSDHPAPSAGLAERLLARAHGCDGAWATDEVGRLQPLFSVVRRDRLAMAPKPTRGLVAWISEHANMAVIDGQRLPADERSALLDVDTREEAEAAGLDASHAPRARDPKDGLV